MATFQTRSRGYPTRLLLSMWFCSWICVQSFVAQPNSLLQPAMDRRQPVTVVRVQSESQQEEEARLNILQARRQQIRDTLKAAETLRYFRIANGFVPETDQDGNKVSDNSKAAVTITAFVLAAGAITLRVGGRAALVSATGIDMIADSSPEIKENLDNFLTTAESMDGLQKSLLFGAAWTAVKVFCFDAGGVVLALASGILFGGVLQGAVASAAAATFGSLVCFGLAKFTFLREKALELLEEYPSLRGIEKVVARDGFKAVLTLRLAPILPIPLGMYNYIYGVTNVPISDFVAGIFLGSLKPYLLDSYLGYFGKEVLQGTSDNTAGLQDFVLLGVLGVSVLIGVFASQLASETWDSVLQEIEEEKKQKEGKEEKKDDVTQEILGMKLPEWMVGFQFSLQDADRRINELVESEYQAGVWNYTKPEEIPVSRDPSCAPDSPEIVQRNAGINLTASLCDGLVLSPILWSTFAKYQDPSLSLDDAKNDGIRKQADVSVSKDQQRGGVVVDTEQRTLLLGQLQELRQTTQAKLGQLDERIQKKNLTTKS